MPTRRANRDGGVMACRRTHRMGANSQPTSDVIVRRALYAPPRSTSGSKRSTTVRAMLAWMGLMVATGGRTHGGSERPPSDENLGEAEVELTNAPTDVSCLRLTIAGPSRTDVRKFPLNSGERSVFHLNGLPVGNA